MKLIKNQKIVTIQNFSGETYNKIIINDSIVKSSGDKITRLYGRYMDYETASIAAGISSIKDRNILGLMILENESMIKKYVNRENVLRLAILQRAKKELELNPNNRRAAHKVKKYSIKAVIIDNRKKETIAPDMVKKEYNAIAYAPLSKAARFNIAVNAIECFLTQYTSKYKFVLKASTTNNFAAFKKETLENGYMLISNEGNENTIYTKPYFNTIARLWHDTLHLDYDLNFSYGDESKVCFLQMQDIEIYLNNNTYNVCTIQDVKELIYHDIINQAKFYQDTNNFVENQKQFVFDKFLNSGAAL